MCLTVDQYKFIKKNYQTHTLYELSVLMDIPESKLRSAIYRAGFRKKRNNLSDDEINKIRNLAKDFSAVKISKMLKMPYETVRAVGKRYDFKFEKIGEKHHCSKYPDYIVEECRSLNDSGIPVSKIAKIKGIKYSTVAGWCNYNERTNIFLNS